MAFHLESDESVGKSIRRIVRKEIDKAQEALAGLPTSSAQEAIHDARKGFKRIRAVVRLVRDELGDETYRKENACFRDAGRPLSEVRDTHALIAALDALADQFAKEVPAETWAPLRAALQERERQAARKVLEEGDTIKQILDSIHRARKRVKDWPIGDGFSALASGLKRSYRGGRQSMRRAVEEPTTENLHEWRKRVKDL